MESTINAIILGLHTVKQNIVRHQEPKNIASGKYNKSNQNWIAYSKVKQSKTLIT